MKFSFNFRPSAEEDEKTVAAGDESKSAGSLNYWCRKFGDPELDEIVEDHRAWVESRGEGGRKADLIGANFEGVDLMGAELPGANLLRANLKGADLLLADLRGACLIEADLTDANLVSTNLRGASLAGANLATATGLVARQLAGASLFGAELPESIYPFEGLAKITSVSRILRVLLVTMTIVCAFVWLIVARTKDVQLLRNSPALGNAMPTVAFYLVAPLLLAGAYIGFHFFLQRLWDALGELPAVFPDGRRLAEYVPASVIALAPARLDELDTERASLRFLQRVISKLMAYWMIPASLVLLWARYLTEQDLRGSLLQIFFILLAAAMSGFLPGNASSIFASMRSDSNEARQFAKPWQSGPFTTATLIACVLLLALSLGAILGAPHGHGRAPELGPTNFRRWTADIFWLVRYDPFPDVTNAAISAVPPGWSGKDEDLALVKGARLSYASLRYAQASHSFFANARMQNADLRGAYLSQADFRGANLREANFDSAVLDRSDLAGADLTYVFLEGAIMVSARLDGANMYAANLSNSRLVRASLQKADLRDTNMNNAEMNQADFRGAYLGSARMADAKLENVQFNGAFLDAADLRGADLRSAIFQGTILGGTELNGANLDGADFRGALAISAAQICSAMSRVGTQMDESIEQQVAALCGN
ncbi:MAG TPA: pentapeptide repeat-containing protein [Candidatus Acidoferrales bacterium]|nr:pentapeptide repeat-containing protein [Candidatus Acidoferrales bacterium]